MSGFCPKCNTGFKIPSGISDANSVKKINPLHSPKTNIDVVRHHSRTKQKLSIAVFACAGAISLLTVGGVIIYMMGKASQQPEHGQRIVDFESNSNEKIEDPLKTKIPVNTPGSGKIKKEHKSVAKKLSQGKEGVKKEKKSKPLESIVELIKRVEISIVRINIKTPRSSIIGSGFLVHESGIVATNFHVVEGATEGSIEFVDGRKLKIIGILGSDPERDISFIKVKSEFALPKPLILRSDFPQKGENVLAFGTPKGFSFTTTEGIVSGIRKSSELQDKSKDKLAGTWIQTSAPISTGSSGGPLIDAKGEVVGMNTFLVKQAQNLNFAISAIDIQLILSDATKKNKVIAFKDTNTKKKLIVSGKRYYANDPKSESDYMAKLRQMSTDDYSRLLQSTLSSCLANMNLASDKMVGTSRISALEDIFRLQSEEVEIAYNSLSEYQKIHGEIEAAH